MGKKEDMKMVIFRSKGAENRSVLRFKIAFIIAS
jgi:hypothetical protein